MGLGDVILPLPRLYLSSYKHGVERECAKTKK
jgi:hypothetical protein